jgi:hypothetical protein
MEERIILSERPEDIKKSGDWIQKQMERQERNRQIGDKSWKRILPVIKAAREANKKSYVVMFIQFGNINQKNQIDGGDNRE